MSELRIRKINEDNEPIAGVKFILTRYDVYPEEIREAYTTIEGTTSFSITDGSYTMSEEPPELGHYIPLAEMNFTISGSVPGSFIDLTQLLLPWYPDLDRISFDGMVNEILNYTSLNPVYVSLMMSKQTIGNDGAGTTFYFELSGAGFYTAESHYPHGIFSFEAEFDMPGIHQFTVREAYSFSSDWDMDYREWPVTVEVVRIENELQAAVTYPNGVPAFVNTYRGEECGTFQFPKIGFDGTGTYEFTIREETPPGDGWETDGRVYRAVVEVVDDGHGHLIATVTYPDGYPFFENAYTVSPAGIIISGIKAAIGAPLPCGRFIFGLYDQNGERIAGATNEP
jgi:pilin isopeptide linkage protein